VNERYPLGGRIRFDIPARGSLPPLKAYWYEGLKKGAKEGASAVCTLQKAIIELSSFAARVAETIPGRRNGPALTAEQFI